MKKIVLLFLVLAFISCSSYNEISKETKIGTEDSHIKIYNRQANFKSLNFGDFKFALDQKQYKKLNKIKPYFKNILFYAKTKDPAYEYYVLYNPIEKIISNNNYIVKDTIIGKSNFVIAISKNAPKLDIAYIMSNIAAIK